MSTVAWRFVVAALGLALMVSALGVVYAKHEARSRFVELQRLTKERDNLDIEWGQLQLEQSAWSTHAFASLYDFTTGAKPAPILSPRSCGDWPAAWVWLITKPASSLRPENRAVTTVLPLASWLSVDDTSTRALSDWARLRCGWGARIASAG